MTEFRVRRGVRIGVFLSLLALFSISSSGAQDDARQNSANLGSNDCDRLAAAPDDLNRQAPGVPFKLLDSERAIPACSAAVSVSPNVKRFQYQLARALNKSGRFEQAAHHYLELVSSDYAVAANDLGLMNANGFGVPRDLGKAAILFRKAAEQGVAVAQVNLGWMYEAGLGVDRDDAAAAKWYRAAADQGDARGQNGLGFRYQMGRGAKRDLTKAVELYRQASEQGFATAQVNLAIMYEAGLGVDRDDAAAAKWYRAAADQGDARGQNGLGFRYQMGRGVERDLTKAVELYRQASEQGFATAQVNLAIMYEAGLGVDRDDAAAAKWYRAAADQGDARGQNGLGFRYQMGRGVERDLTKAVELYRQASEQGFATAQVNLGYAYANAQGVERDYTAADRWFRAAAKANNGAAMQLLGWMAEFGRGSNFNSAKAYVWYRLAARAGVNEAFASVGRVVEGGVSGDITGDEFLSADDELVAEAKKRRDQNQQYAEAAGWYEKGIQAGSRDAFLLLGNLQLKAVFTPRFGALSRQDQIPFMGSVSRAAELYKEAVERGSNAARLNLARLYQLGVGVKIDRDAAVALYNNLIGSTFDGPARLGLLFDSVDNLWEKEKRKWKRQLSFLDDQEHGPQSDVVVEAISDSTSFSDSTSLLVTDAIGRRVFSGFLRKGEQYHAPAGRNDLIVWTPFGDIAKSLVVGVGPKTIKIPDNTAGIRLDRGALLNGDGFAIVPNDRYRLPEAITPEQRKQSRITLKMDGASNLELYVHSADDLIGFDITGMYSAGFDVPDLNGLTLDFLGNDSYRSTLEIDVDGKHLIDLAISGSCAATVDLSPDLLTKIFAGRIHKYLCRNYMLYRRSTSSHHNDNSVVRIQQRDKRLLNHGVIKEIAGYLHINQGIALLNLQLSQRFDELARAYRIILDRNIREYGHNSFATIQSELDLCATNLELGRYAEVRGRLDTILDTLKSMPPAPESLRTKLYTTYGLLMWRQGRDLEADEFFSIAGGLAEESARKTATLATDHAWGWQAGLAEDVHQYDRALAFKLRQQIVQTLSNPERDETFRSESAGLNSIVDLLYRTKRGEQAQQLLSFAYQEDKREIARDVPEPLKFPMDLRWSEQTFGPVERSGLIADSLGNLGQAYSWLGRHTEALPLLEQQANTRSNIYSEANPRVGEVLAKIADEHRLLAKPAEALTVARKAYADAIAYVDSRGSAGDTAISAARAVGPPAFSLLEALHALSEADAAPEPALAQEAFEVAQRLQASTAASALQAFEARLAQNDPLLAKFLRRQQDLGEELRGLDARLVETVTERGALDFSQEQEIKGRIKDAEGRFAALKAQRPQKLQGVDALGSRQRVVTYAELQNVLRPDEAVIVVVPGPYASFVFAATRNQLAFKRTDFNDFSLDTMVATLRCGLDRMQWVVPQDNEHCQELTGGKPISGRLPFRLDTANKLYQALFAPLDETISGKQLMLVATGALTSVPPQVLVARPVAEALPQTSVGYRGVAWMGREHAIAILPEVASLPALRRLAARERAPLPYLGLGNPSLEGNPQCQEGPIPATCPRAATQVALNTRSGLGIDDVPLRAGFADIGALRRICPLPDSAIELRCVAKTVDAKQTDLLLGPALTLGAIKAARLDRYRILHFATHGLLPDQTARFLNGTNEPSLVLTPPATSRPGDPGLLTASDIAGLKLNADWVVLSACNTAGGDRPGSEALSGLARAFFYAGARTLLVSHWEVASGAAVLLTTRVFDAIAHNPHLGPAEALRLSMTELMDEPDTTDFVRPQYWAPFVVVGDVNAELRQTRRRVHT